jgi:uncharacterized protein (DUF488 family)
MASRTKTIYTLGSSTRGPQEFIALLKIYRINKIIDVRSFPTSRFEHFKQENLEDMLKQSGIKYVYLGNDLGGYRKGGYEAYTKTQAYRHGISKIEGVATKESCAILCAERFPWKCHRRFIANSLQMLGWKVIHVLDEKRVWESAAF